MRVFSATDIGQKRKMNQDYIFASDAPVGNLPNLFVVADGMGGHNAGDYASSHAVLTMVDEIRRDEGINVVRVLRHAIESANTRIVEDARADESLFGMGTTLVAAAVVGEFAYVANVGDSRLYLINDGIRQVTRDHSLVEEMIRMGEIRPEEARTHPDKNIITRAIGAEDTVDIDFFEIELQQGDTLLMCSDGLSNMVEDERIGELVRASGEDLAQKGEALVREANQNGGKDNIAIILVEI